MASAGTVTVDFVAETSRFTSELKKVNGSLKSMEGGFGKLASAAKVAIGALSVGAFAAFVKSAADAADALGKTADKLGVSTESLRTFQIAAGEAGVELGVANKLLTESQKRLGEAATGTGEAAKYIKLLGLNVKDLQSLSPEELFATYSDSINGLANRSEQLAAANALMGKSAQEAFSLIQAGSPAIEDAAAFVERFGLALSRVEIKQIEQANDALGRIKTVSEAAGQRIAAGLSPAIEYFANVLLDATGNTKDLQSTMEQFGSVAIAAFEIIANGARALQAAFFGIAAGAARVLQFLTFGDVSESFGASVDENLSKADAALQKIKSIEEIQLTIARALEESRAKAEAAVADQAARDAAAAAGGLSLNETEGFALTQQQQLDLATDAARAAAEAQAQIEKELTKQIGQEFKERASMARNQREYELGLAQRQAQEEIALRSQATNAFVQGIGLLASKSKTAARLQKFIAIAEAVRNTYVGITKQLSSGDPYTAIARAAAVGVFGFAQVAAIKATSETGQGGGSFGGTFSPPAFSAGSSSGDAEQFGATSQSAVQVIISGNVGFDQRVIDQLVEGIREATDGRDVILFGPNSRQAQELVTVT